MKKLSLLIAVIAIASGCSPRMSSSGKSKPVTQAQMPSQEKPSPEPIPDVIGIAPVAEPHAQGKLLFEQNCASCHKLYSPSDFTKEQWVPIVNSMRRNADLDETQGNLIYEYLAANAKS